MGVDLPAVFGIGVLTLGTPCVLPLIPIYLGLLLGAGVDAVREPGGRARLLSSTAAFALGFGLVFTLLGLGASAVGSFLQAHRTALTVAGSLVIVLFGLKYLGLLRLPWLDREVKLPELKTGRRLVDAALFGVVFALGWTPCIGPTLAAVQSLAFTEGSAARGALLSLAYCIGLGLPFLVIGLAMERGLGALAWARRHTRVIQWVGGVSLILLGLAMVTGVWGSLSIAMRGWISGFEVPL